MSEKEARALVSALIAAFPQATVEQETFDLYTAQFVQLDSVAAAAKALDVIVRSARHFPTVAEFREVYHARLRDERSGFAAWRGLDEGERPPVPELALGFIASLGGKEEGKTAEQEVDELPPAGPGRCDDCGESLAHAPRFLYASLSICRPCAVSRTRVKRELAA